MSKQTTNPVKLKYSRAVKKGRTSSYTGSEKYRQEDEFYNIQTPRGDLSKMVDGGILEKRIASYRHWFKFLKLAIELEQQNAVLIYKKKHHKIKVNKSMYEGWNLDKVLTMKFDDWWKGHRHLFIDDISRVLSNKDKVSNDDNRVTIEFDKNRRLADVVKDLRRMNKEQNMFRNQSNGFISNFVINGRVIDATLQNRFNALILKLEGKLKNKEILTHENNYIRPTSKSQKGYASQRMAGGITDEDIDDPRSDAEKRLDDKLVYKDVEEPNWGYTIHELINGSSSTTGAKQILLSVCDGYFLKHPTKTYLDDEPEEESDGWEEYDEIIGLD
jgi:hypothetical protein